jgi:hypothetical protein
VVGTAEVLAGHNAELSRRNSPPHLGREVHAEQALTQGIGSRIAWFQIPGPFLAQPARKPALFPRPLLKENRPRSSGPRTGRQPLAGDDELAKLSGRDKGSIVGANAQELGRRNCSAEALHLILQSRIWIPLRESGRDAREPRQIVAIKLLGPPQGMPIHRPVEHLGLAAISVQPVLKNEGGAPSLTSPSEPTTPGRGAIPAF